MKTFLLIWVISLHDGQQPTVQKLEQPDMPSCQAQAKAVMAQLGFDSTGHWLACGKQVSGCSAPYIARTSCLTGS
jgi:hypothetical protein